MSLATFPTLPGQGWSVVKRPRFSTRVASHSSGREVRLGLYAHALYEFELTSTRSILRARTPGLQAQSLQSLMGFWLACGGQFATFLYVDPTDNAAANQVIAIGDGATTTFTFGRAIGGFYEPVSYVPAHARNLDPKSRARRINLRAKQSAHIFRRYDAALLDRAQCPRRLRRKRSVRRPRSANADGFIIE